MPTPHDDEREQAVPGRPAKAIARENGVVKALASKELMDTLQTVTDAVTGKATTGDALEKIVGSAVSLLGADAGTLQIADNGKQVFSLIVDCNVPADFLNDFAALASDPESIYQRACESHEQIVIPDATLLDEDDLDRHIAEVGGFAALHATPLINGSRKCAGLLTLYFQEPLTDADSYNGALNLIARQVLTVIKHRQQRARLAELVSALRERSKELESSERKLTVQTAELREQVESRENFISMLGHELRNPLAAIVNSLELIDLTKGSAKTDKTGQQHESTFDNALGVIRRQSQHLRRLIDDLLDINRLSRGKLFLRLETVNINKSIEEVLNVYRPRLDDRNLQLSVSLPAQPLDVLADPERVTQILDNLLRNAISFTAAGGEISIAARRESSFAAITVRDDGIGMDETRLSALFDPENQRLAGSRDGGLGLGLLLVRQLVDLHGGAIAAESPGVGEGSTFTVRLPLAATRNTSADTDESASLDFPAPHRVLVVDDKPDNADALSAVLSRFGQQVKTAYNGETALETARQFSPDVAFLDLSMPLMDGYELAERLRAQFADDHLTLVALTGQPHMQQSSLFDHHVMKPIRADMLIELLNEIDVRH